MTQRSIKTFNTYILCVQNVWVYKVSCSWITHIANLVCVRDWSVPNVKSPSSSSTRLVDVYFSKVTSLTTLLLLGSILSTFLSPLVWPPDRVHETTTPPMGTVFQTLWLSDYIPFNDKRDSNRTTPPSLQFSPYSFTSLRYRKKFCPKTFRPFLPSGKP